MYAVLGYADMLRKLFKMECLLMPNGYAKIGNMEFIVDYLPFVGVYPNAIVRALAPKLCFDWRSIEFHIGPIH